jgi:hypothetical protein
VKLHVRKWGGLHRHEIGDVLELSSHTENARNPEHEGVFVVVDIRDGDTPEWSEYTLQRRTASCRGYDANGSPVE